MLDLIRQIFQKNGFIYCMVDDWRGPIKVNGFPVITVESAVRKLIEASLFEYYVHKEAQLREVLIKNYPIGYGEYEPRKYCFEEILKAMKEYHITFYKCQMKAYVKQINKNKKTKFSWFFDEKTDTFVTKPFFDTLAVNVDKIHAIVNVYNQDPCGRLLDNFYTYKETIHKKNYIRFCFTNYNIRFYLDVYQPNKMEETEEYIHINSAEKIIWTSENCNREFRTEDNKVVIKK